MINKKAIMKICVIMMAAAAMFMLSLTAFAADNDDDYSAAAEYQTLSSSSERSPGKIIGVTLGVSVGGTFLVVFKIYRGYKFNGKTEPYLYNKKAPLDLVESEDIHVDTKVDRRKINRDKD